MLKIGSQLDFGSAKSRGIIRQELEINLEALQFNHPKPPNGPNPGSQAIGGYCGEASKIRLRGGARNPTGTGGALDTSDTSMAV